MLLKDLPDFKKPREKLRDRGPSALSEVELLATLIGSGSRQGDALSLARQILSQYSLAQLSQLSLTQLQKLPGIGFARACLILSACYWGKIAAETALPIVVNQPQIVFQLVQEIANKKQEYLLGLYLDGRHQLLAKETISLGTLTSSLLHPREVFAPAINYHAAAVIVAHNHPSGEVDPSEEDIQATDKLVAAGEILDIPLLDHVIVSGHKWQSLKELKLI